MTTRTLFAFALCLMLIAGCGVGAIEPQPAPIAETFVDAEHDREIDYLLFTPHTLEDDGETTYPLLIVLHDEKEEGDNLAAFHAGQLRPAPLDEFPGEFPFFVLMPRSETGGRWQEELGVLNRLLDAVIAEHPIDAGQIFLSGSEGVWAWATHAPDRFAALVSMSGNWPYRDGPQDDPRPCLFHTIPIRLYPGDTNQVAAQALADALQACGAAQIEVDLTILNPLDDADLLRWLSEQHITPPTAADPRPRPEPDRYPLLYEMGTLANPGYLVSVPDTYADDASSTYPVLIYLHGAGWAGEDIDAFAGTVDETGFLEALGGDWPFIVVIPQSISNNDAWVNQVFGLDGMLDQVIENYRVDPNRVYLTGYSMGGGGVYAWAVQSPDRFAALAPTGSFWPFLTPPADDLTACSIAGIPTWILHGANDSGIPKRYAEEIYAALTACGMNDALYLTRFAGFGHMTAVGRIYRDPALYRWLLAQSR